jgi:hypothetical protein
VVLRDISRGVNVQILEISARKLCVCDYLDLAISLLLNGYRIPKISNQSIDLDFVVEELLECIDVEYFVARGLRSVDDELWSWVVSILSARASKNEMTGR